jgi:hypothetical protein
MSARMPTKTTSIAPLFKADSATLTFYASKDGKVTVSFQWDASKVVLDGEVFEVSWGPQGVEGRILPKRGARRGG